MLTTFLPFFPAGQVSGLQTPSSSSTASSVPNGVPKKHEVSLAITLVAISVLFICCQSLKIVTDVYELFCEKIEIRGTFGGAMVCVNNPIIEVVIILANLSTCVNSAANFLVYMLRGKKFRDLFLETYCCCR
jgi:hypothetical protein